MNFKRVICGFFILLIFFESKAFAKSFKDQAVEAENRGDLQEALKLYKEQLKSGPQEPWLLAVMGGVEGKLGDFKPELDYTNQALKLDPRYIMALINRGNAYAGLRKLNEAEKDFKRASGVNPEASLPFYSLGVLHEAKLELKLAESDYLRCIELNRKDENCFFNLGTLEARLGNSKKAREYIQEVIKLNPDAQDAMAVLQSLNGDLKSRENDPSRGSKVPSEQNKNQKLTGCSAQDKIYFRCLTRVNKKISVCGSQDFKGDKSWLQYQFENEKKIEMIFPEKRLNSLQSFRWNTMPAAGGSRSELSFKNQDAKYTLSLFSQDDEDSATLSVDAHKSSDISCKGKIEIGEIDKFKLAVKCDPTSALGCK